MHVKQKLHLNATVILVSILAVVVALMVTALHVARAMEQDAIAEKLISASFERLALRTDYMRTGSWRAWEQFTAKNKQIGESLKAAVERFPGDDDRKALSALVRGQEAMGNLFNAFVANRTNERLWSQDPELLLETEDRLLSQLNMRVYEAIALTGKLQKSSHETVISSIWKGGATIALVCLVMGGATLMNTFSVNGAIAARIARLTDGASALGKGELGHTIEMQGDDEFTVLAAAFNDMSAKLKDSDQERTKVEMALQKARDELAQQFEERTNELREKEVLLKEIHHRVKNNLQVISSLVNLQAASSNDETVSGVLRDVKDRVRSMALVHEKLYQSADLACIDFSEYIRSLLGYLWRAHGTESAVIRLALDLEPVSLPVDTAVPLGLILNELTGNALKHAFRGRSQGEVMVTLKKDSDGRIALGVSDNGIGLPKEFEMATASSLGIRLVLMLAGQLGATMEVGSGGGTRFDICIPG